MKKCIYLDFSLPVFLQKNLSSRYFSFLKSLIKNIDKTSNLKYYISINIFNEFHLPEDIFNDLLRLIKSLQEQDRVEIVLSSSFNTSNLSNEHVHVYDLLYSEYFSGFYLGLPRDFEGDSCIMIKNLHSVFFPEGEINSLLIDSSKLLKLERIFVDSNLISDPSTIKGLKIVPVDRRASGLFASFITNDSLDDFLNHTAGSVVYYLNIFDIFTENFQNTETNFSNLLYLLDKRLDSDFIDIDDENMKYSEIVNPVSPDTSFYQDRNDINFHSIKDFLVKNISHIALSIENLEDYSRSPIWKYTGQSEIDKQNMFNLRLMTLLSKEVVRKNILLNNDLEKHLNDIIDELITNEFCNSELKSELLSFKDKINLKPTY